MTAAVVALPLALAFGVASGLGAIAGRYGAVAVGFFASVFGGTKTGISGPTGPMAVAMAVVIANHAGNDIAHALTIVVLAGFIQILMGVARIGRLVSYTPHSVISGFMSGIGVIIIVIQTLPFLGLPVKEGGPLETIRNWPQAVEEVNWSALAVAAVTLGVGLTWPRRLLPSATHSPGSSEECPGPERPWAQWSTYEPADAPESPALCARFSCWRWCWASDATSGRSRMRCWPAF